MNAIKIESGCSLTLPWSCGRYGDGYDSDDTYEDFDTESEYELADDEEFEAEFDSVDVDY